MKYLGSSPKFHFFFKVFGILSLTLFLLSHRVCHSSALHICTSSYRLLMYQKSSSLHFTPIQSKVMKLMVKLKENEILLTIDNPIHKSNEEKMFNALRTKISQTLFVVRNLQITRE